MKKETEAICCPRINPDDWNDITFSWEKKPFIKANVRTFFYIPLNFGSVIRKIDKKLRAKGLDFSEGICLSDHTSRWNMNIYISVNKPFDDNNITLFTGNYYCKMYEGNFKDTALWCADYKTAVKDKRYKETNIYMWYTTCPKCAKKYGKNYVGIFSKVN